MTFSTLAGRYWRVLVVAAIGATLAFAGSFLKEPTYSAETRLLIRGRDATFLTSTAQDLAGQPGVIDASLSQSLAATYAGIATSRAVAEQVVTETALDRRPESSGPIAAMAHAFAWVYRCTRAVVTSGFCADVDPHEKAVLYVQEGTKAMPLGVNSGPAAGTTGSYVLAISSIGPTPEEAKAVTDAVADALVSSSNERFKGDVKTYISNLQAQLAVAEQQVAAKSTALADYQTAHGIAAADGRQQLSATTYETLRKDYLAAKATEADASAQLASINASLAAVPRTERSSQTIVTGRSTTSLDTNSASSVYQDLTTRRAVLQAQLDGATARVAALQHQIDAAAPLSNNAAQAELATLQKSVDLAEANRTSVATALQRAQVTAASGVVELTRLDTAALPVYPTEPKRYIYLALGLLLGALGGWWLSPHPAGALGGSSRTSAPATGGADGEVQGPDEGGEYAVPGTPGPGEAADDRDLVTALLGSPAPQPGQVAGLSSNGDHRASRRGGGHGSPDPTEHLP